MTHIQRTFTYYPAPNTSDQSKATLSVVSILYSTLACGSSVAESECELSEIVDPRTIEAMKTRRIMRDTLGHGSKMLLHRYKVEHKKEHQSASARECQWGIVELASDDSDKKSSHGREAAHEKRMKRHYSSHHLWGSVVLDECLTEIHVEATSHSPCKEEESHSNE